VRQGQSGQEFPAALFGAKELVAGLQRGILGDKRSAYRILHEVAAGPGPGLLRGHESAEKPPYDGEHTENQNNQR
jgi:hypothetical protein